jgi:hypothetical protein
MPGNGCNPTTSDSGRWKRKKTIRIKFLDYWKEFPSLLDKDQPGEYLPFRLLEEHFNVIICDDADYVFFNALGESHWKVPDSAVKIFHKRQTGLRVDTQVFLLSRKRGT